MASARFEPGGLDRKRVRPRFEVPGEELASSICRVRRIRAAFERDDGVRDERVRLVRFVDGSADKRLRRGNHDLLGGRSRKLHRRRSLGSRLAVVGVREAQVDRPRRLRRDFFDED